MSETDRRIAAPFARLEARLAGTPNLREKVFTWLAGLSPTAEPADYFRQPRTIPIIQFPVWIAEALGAEPDLAFQDDVAYSTIAGYCHIRLLDDIMDKAAGCDPALLPATSFFHAEFQSAYTRYFPPDHLFWDRFAALWFGAAEATTTDAGLTAITLSQFRDISSLKVSPAGIPIIATCLHYRRPDVLPLWLDVCDRLGSVAQMTDDLLDWEEDLGQNRATYFLSEAERRRAPDEPPSVWILREGFGWGVDTLRSWYRDLHAAAAGVRSDGLSRHLLAEETTLAERASRLIPGYRSLASLAGAWPR